MDKRVKLTGPPLPLPSLRLLVSPLRLMYSFVWQVVIQRNVMHYGKVEEFVTLVMETVPELLSLKQSAQLILGLRARMILELFRKDNPPNPQAIQRLLDNMNICTSLGKQDPEVEESQANFVALVQTLLRNPNERKHFFQEVFPVQYGPKYDAALQALVGGLVFRLEQLLPMPDLSQIGAMITAAPSVLEACGQTISDADQLKILLQHQHQQLKGRLNKSVAITSSVGDCVLSSLSFRLTPKEPPNQPEFDDPPVSFETAQNLMSPASFSDLDLGEMSDDLDYNGAERVEGNTGDDRGVTQKQKDVSVTINQMSASHEDALQKKKPEYEVTSKGGMLPFPIGKQQQLITLMTGNIPKPSPLQIVISSNATANGNLRENPRLGLTSLHQWVSQIASNTISLPALPPLPQNRDIDKEMGLGDICLGSSVVIGAQETDADPMEKAITRKKMGPQKRKVKPKKKKTPEATHICPECGKKFLYQSQLEDHQRIHTGERPFKCTHCARAFRTSGLLTTHQKIHTTERPFKCDECDKSFLKKADLQKHMRVHTGEKPYKCTICKKGFTQASYHKIHMECHTSDKTFPCTYCEKIFPTPFKLSNHLRWHTLERPHVCDQCGKSFFCPSLLKRHMGYHIGDRQFLCAQCGRTFVYLFDLKKHQRDHGPKPQLPCPICQKVFPGNGNLKVHIRTHSSERPHRCTICDKAFGTLNTLRVHTKLHSNERPYRCNECGKTYKLSSHLREHKTTHTGVKRCHCATCGKGFRYISLLKKHEELHSGERAERTRRYSHTSQRRRHSSKRMPDY